VGRFRSGDQATTAPLSSICFSNIVEGAAGQQCGQFRSRPIRSSPTGAADASQAAVKTKTAQELSTYSCTWLIGFFAAVVTLSFAIEYEQRSDRPSQFDESDTWQSVSAMM
jgi:hypothetical protein